MLYIDDKCLYRLKPNEIDKVLYSIDIQDDMYYFWVIEKYKERNAKSNIKFTLKYDIKYKTDNLKQFIQDISRLGISLYPNIGQYMSKYDNLLKYCTAKNNYLLTILDINNDIYISKGIFDCAKNMQIKMLDFINVKQDFQECIDSMSVNEVIDKGIYLFDKEIMINQKYLLVPFERVGVHQTYIVTGSEFYYCNNEDEIKQKSNNILLFNQTNELKHL